MQSRVLTLVLRTSKGVVIPLAQAPARAPAKRKAGGADMRRVGPINLEEKKGNSKTGQKVEHSSKQGNERGAREAAAAKKHKH